MLVTITFNNNYGAVPYTAASVKTPFATAGEALNYAFVKTQNIDESWSESKSDEITIAHHHFDGTPLRSSMVGDDFVVWSSSKDFIKYRCEPIGWTEL